MTLSRINKILIANRGEIACRIIKTAKKMGIQTVAVYSEPDKDSLHVKMASEAYCIGPAAAQQSYLRADKLVSVAKLSGAHAIHPGYGFLSESAEFADLCSQEGLLWVGPPPSAIRDMGIKSTSKTIMQAAGVPVVLGYHGENQDRDFLKGEAEKIGFPVMIKAVRGGGGKGMRIAMTSEQFFEQLDSAKREAMKSFNDEGMLLEKYIDMPRHVEVQIFGDQHGNYVHLCERDCSVQRRHQKVLEEAPGPGIDSEVRAKLGSAAVRAASAVDYEGAGTVEFIMDRSGSFFFMEMNTRLQVEHPVTELITGLDLVEWQVRVAAGEPLPVTDQSQLGTPKGHAIEARVYAEDCSRGFAGEFLPTAGVIKHLRTPATEEGGSVRLDCGIEEGDTISVHYDPMIAKLIVWAHDRPTALGKLVNALADFRVVGLPTNMSFLRGLLEHDAFVAGDVHTGFIGQHSEALRLHQEKMTEVRDEDAVLTAVALLELGRSDEGVGVSSAFNAAGLLSGFRVNHSLVQEVRLSVVAAASEETHERKVVVTVEWLGEGEFSVWCGEEQWRVSVVGRTHGSDEVRLAVEGGSRCAVSVVREGADQLHVFLGGRHLVLGDTELLQRLQNSGQHDKHGLVLGLAEGVAPMPGVVEKLLVAVGDSVAQGQPLATMIAMKMEYSVRAARPGIVAAVKVAEGQTVAKGDVLVELESLSGDKETL